MTVEELQEKLKSLPKDAIVTISVNGEVYNSAYDNGHTIEISTLPGHVIIRSPRY